MKKILTGLCFAITLAVTLLLSCNKDRQLSPQQTSLIDKAEKWYLKSVNETSKSMFAVKPNWNEALFLTSPQGEQLIVVPANKENKTNNPKFGMTTAFVFATNANAIVSGQIVQAFGEADYMEDQLFNIIPKYKEQSISGFKQGAIITYDINHNFLNGYSYVNGQRSQIGAELVAGRISPDVKNIAQTQSVSGKLMRAKLGGSIKLEPKAQSNNKLRVASTYSTEGEDDGGGDNGGGGGGGGGGGTYTGGGERNYGNCIDWYLVTWDTTTGQILSTIYQYTTCLPAMEGGAITSYDNQNYIIIDSLQGFPCAQEILSKLPNISVKAHEVLYNIFGINENINIVFKSSTSLASNIDGEASSSYGYTFNTKVLLNQNVLESASNDYIVATMIHEVIHGYIQYNRATLDTATFKTRFKIYWDNLSSDASHEQMAGTYVSEMKTIMQNYNPSIPDSVAWALAWGGLQGTTVWKTLPDTNIIKSINQMAKHPTLTDYNNYNLKRCTMTVIQP